jgi:5'-nucleotidase
MNILVTNDDGYDKKGIQRLIELMSTFGNVCVVAPQTDQSGQSHSLTLHEPLKYKKVKENQYVVRGTPADCVHFATHHLWPKDHFDLCVSGINHGANIGDDVWYSGTVGGAVEAAIQGIASMAVSMIPAKKSFNFESGVQFLKDWLTEQTPQLWPHTVVPNINIPPYEGPLEYQWTQLGPKRYISQVEVREDLKGNEYFWIGGSLDEYGTEEGTDSYALSQNKVSITPLGLNITHQAYLKEKLASNE